MNQRKSELLYCLRDNSFTSTLTSASMVRKDKPSAAHFLSSMSFLDFVKKLNTLGSKVKHQLHDCILAMENSMVP